MPRKNPPKEKRFKPGQSGNPSGRPEGSKNRSTVARQVLSMIGMFPKKKLKELKEIFPQITNKMTVEEIMTIVQAGRATTKADPHSYEKVMDSAYGKPKQDIDLAGNLNIAQVLDELDKKKLKS